MPPRLRVTLTSLGTPPDPTAFAEVVRAVGDSWAELDRLRRTAGTPVGVPGLTGTGLRAHLASQLTSRERVVKTVWPADGIATRMTAARLIASVDALRYPSTDGLVVLQEGTDGTSVLVLDHEERSTVIRMHGDGYDGAGHGQGPTGSRPA
ncbi:hypothetical protein ACFUJ0_02135 [Streptomyces sp. NPDC057242]|uniref:hypothetical protein n=1 Tax=unclassified Streptomyces TaxID=2593676 RepID=UPI003624E852